MHFSLNGGVPCLNMSSGLIVYDGDQLGVIVGAILCNRVDVNEFRSGLARSQLRVVMMVIGAKYNRGYVLVCFVPYPVYKQRSKMYLYHFLLSSPYVLRTTHSIRQNRAQSEIAIDRAALCPEYLYMARLRHG